MAWIGAGTWREARKVENGDVVEVMIMKLGIIVFTKVMMMIF